MVQIPDRRHLRFGLGDIGERLLEPGKAGLPSRAIAVRSSSVARRSATVAGTFTEMQFGQTLKYPAHGARGDRPTVRTMVSLNV
jgi:hypothetical protein